MNVKVILSTLFIVLVLTACSNNTPQEQEKIKLIFETDMGNDVDDALALDMIYKYMEADKVDLLAIMSNKNSRYSVEFTDIMATWYGHAGIPVGIVQNGVDSENDAVNYARSVCEMTVDGKPAFERTLSHYESLPEASVLYRKILAGQPDRSVTIVSVGFSTNIAKLLDTPADAYSLLSGKDLVAAKVRQLVVMAGSFGEKPLKEYNIVKDISAAQKVFAEWPAPIAASPFEVGIKINYPAASIENDFDWEMLHPMVEAYKAYLPMPYDRPTWDLTAVLYAAEPDSVFMSQSPSGTIVVDSAGYTTFTADENGKHSYFVITDEQSEKIKNYFVRLISQKPLKYTKK
ncbi:MAG: nucleoside hydrolase [Dysgonamonadaceae bacterium]|jgi:inosine-uridine nucleoside N-ribohydrolase|nr:nucleoside hydrolase [Dysgonamonadaceae bacterium]